MFDGELQDPLALTRLLAAAAVSVPAIVASLLMPRPPQVRSGTAAVLGWTFLSALWLVVIPGMVARSAFGGLVVLYGSDTQPVSAIDLLAAANFASAAALLLWLASRSETSVPMRGALLASAVLVTFTMLDEAGLHGGAALPFPTDLIPTALVAPGYAIAGGLLIAGALLLWWASPENLRRAPLLLMLRGSPHAASLMLTTGLLLQHPMFEEVAEFAFSATALYALVVGAPRGTGATSASAEVP